MIADLDKTLKALLARDLRTQGYSVVTQDNPSDESGTTNEVIISFVTPEKWWADAVDKATINLFLYDIRENVQLRNNERYLTRNGASGTENFSPVRIDFTYLVSAWAKKELSESAESPHVEEEHRLLGKVLTILLRYPILPKEVLQGEIEQQSRIPGAQLPRAWIAQPEDTPKTWEFWGSNEWRLKAGISYRVILNPANCP